MAWNRISEGALVTFEDCSALSNIPAGTLVGLAGQISGGVGITQVGTLGDTVAGISATAWGLGMHFIGVTDEALSAGDSPVTVWTQGVFKLQIASGSIDASMFAGHPVWAHSGNSILIDEAGNGTADAPIGTIVGFPTGTLSTGGAGQLNYVFVKIRPAAYRWTIYNSSLTAATSATAPEALCWPVQGA